MRYRPALRGERKNRGDDFFSSLLVVLALIGGVD